jgi:uncharacterized membrane protein YgaE (UPF0421/DUF939 family)
MTTAPAPDTAGPDLRVAFAAGLCTFLAMLLRLDYSYMAVMSAYMTLVKFEFTAFQRGLERFLGRALGVLFGLLLLSLFRAALGPLLLASWVSLTAAFYVYQAGRLAYTWLNFGLYLTVILTIGLDDPRLAFSAAPDILASLLLGMVVADLVNWLTGGDLSLALQTGTTPLWPLRRDWLNAALRLVFMTVLVAALCRWADLSPTTVTVSVIILGLSTDQRAMWQKGRQRLGGALLGGLWSAATAYAVLRLPHLILLVGLIFLGTFLAAHVARTSAAHGYVGLQMGLVMCMVLPVPARSLGSLSEIRDRLYGVAFAVAVNLLVLEVWPSVGITAGNPARTETGAPSG